MPRIRVYFVVISCLTIASGRTLLADVFQMPGNAKSLEMLPVGDLNNPNDPVANRGRVEYSYSIGKYEVTSGQYAAFLNAVAKTDTYSLYHHYMGTHENTAVIAQSGSPGNYTYTPIGSPNNPVVWVNWGDAARFANWLTNGQPTAAQDNSTTENGSYALNGTTTSAALALATRTASARYVIPTDAEWHKAAYYDPMQGAGGGDNYWAYPTRRDAAPHSAKPAGGSAPDPGNVGNFWQNDNLANGYDDGYAVTGNPILAVGITLSQVGAYTNTFSHYGLYDLCGNASEWTESLTPSGGRIYRGGSWAFVGSNSMAAPGYALKSSIEEDGFTGFRIAFVPEPGTLCLMAIAVLGLRRPFRLS